MNLRYFAIILLIIISFSVKSQNIRDGFYTDRSSGEFLLINERNFQFRLKNHDAFNTYSLGKGIIKPKKGSKYEINMSSEISEMTSKVNKFISSNSLISIYIKDNNLTPIKYATIRFYLKNSEKSILKEVFLSDENGSLTLSLQQANLLCNKNILIEIQTLGFYTKKEILLEKFSTYEIISTIPNIFPFVIFQSNFFYIKSVTSDTVQITLRKKGNIINSTHSSYLVKMKDEYIDGNPFRKF